MTRADLVTLLLLSLLALVVGGIGALVLPLSDPESHIALAVQGLLDAGHWSVLSLPDTPQLDYPPLVYWLVAGVAKLAGQTRVEGLTVRVPELLSGLLLVWMVYATARRERGLAAGLLAGLVVVVSPGFASGAPDGQPAMLYAMLAFAVFFFYWLTRLASGVRQWLAALAMWVVFVLLVLAGGPQYGVWILLGCFLYDLIAGHNPRTTWCRFRPIIGVIVIAGAVWLWPEPFLQHIGPQPAGQLWFGGWLQSAGVLSMVHGQPWLMALLLVLPWVLLVIPALAAMGQPSAVMARMLPVLLILLVAVLSCSSWLATSGVFGAWVAAGTVFPVLGFAALWLALGGAWVCRFENAGSSIIYGLQIVILLLLTGSIIYWAWLFFATATIFLIIGAVVALLVLGALLLLVRRGKSGAGRMSVWLFIAAALGIAWVPATVIPQTWHPARFYLHQLTHDLKAFPDRPVAVLVSSSSDELDFYLDRHLTIVADVEDLCHWAKQHQGERPLVLYNPSMAGRIHRALALVHPLLQSPGSVDSSVIAAGVKAPGQCRSAGQATESDDKVREHP